jgi:hypothetical protein
LAEKWEAKRKNISDEANPEDVEFAGAADGRGQRSSATMEQNKLVSIL